MRVQDVAILASNSEGIKAVKSFSPPVVAEVGNYIVHNINQQWDHPLLLITVEDHVQQMSQHLTNKVHIYSCQSDTMS